MQIPIRGLAITLSAACMLVSWWTPQHTQASATTPGSIEQVDGYFVFPNLAGHLSNAQTVTIVGQHQGDGCSYVLRSHITRLHPVLAQQVVAYSPSTCQERVEQGVPQDAATTPVPYILCCGGTPHDRAHQYSKWTDLAGIRVNSVETFVDWYWDGNCDLSTTFPAPNYYALWQTSWYLVSSSDTPYSSCSLASNASTAHFRNVWFCHIPGDPTDAYYNFNTVDAYPDGSIDGVTWSYVSGGCSGILAPYAETRYDF